MAAARFTKPSTRKAGTTKRNTPKRRVDAAVRPAAFEDEGPKLAADSDSSPPFRSVVINRDGADDTIRSAQFPSDDSTSQPAETTQDAAQDTTLDSQLEEQLRSPFGQQPGAADEPGTLAPDEPTGVPPNNFLAPQRPLPSVPIQRDPSVLNEPPGPTPQVADAVIEEERRRSAAACEQSLEALRLNTIATVELEIEIVGEEGADYPYECSLDDGVWHPGRTWHQTTYLWKASALCHKPLYFEDEQLERYGHSFAPCCQPLVSGAHFFCTLPVLPYCMGVKPPLECEYALGHYRPGSCAPYMIEPIPLSPRGAVIQAGAVVGAAAVLP